MDTGLAQRVVMITGASGGIGQQVARVFAGEGARCILHFNQHGEEARALARELPGCLALGADLTDEGEVGRLFAEGEGAVGPVEILVANAGLWPPQDMPLEQMSLQQWNQTIAVNLTSVFLCLRQFFRGIVKHQLSEPAAILVGSTAGIFGEAGHADYATAKAGLTYGLTRTLKNELSRLSPRGRINVVCPGWTVTPMARTFAGDSPRVRRALQTIPLRKVARPEDVAMAILYLASSRLSGHVTGQVLTVSGGMEGRVLYAEEEVDPGRA